MAFTALGSNYDANIGSTALGQISEVNIGRAATWVWLQAEYLP
jgi:hypothetical protein